MTHYVDGVAALEVLRGVTEPEAGLCLAATWTAYNAEGAQSDTTYPTAASAFGATGGFHNGDYAPPAGYPVWFGTRSDGEDSGDVGISSGNGNMVGVWDLGTHEVSISDRAAEIHRPYLGWTENFMTDNIVVPGVGSNITLRPTADVQTKVGVPPQDVDGDYGPQTTWYVRAFQASHGLEVDGIYGPLTDAALFGSAPMPGAYAKGADYSDARPGGAALAAAGIIAVGRYLAGDPTYPAALSPDELADLSAHGIAVWVNYEAASNGMLGGYAQGVAHGQKAAANLQRLGLTVGDVVVYASGDFDVQDADLPACDAYMDGYSSVLGAPAVMGIYGGMRIINHMRANGKATWFWKAAASSWDHGETGFVHIAQTTNASLPGTDDNIIYAAQFGQIGGVPVVGVPASSGGGSSAPVGSVTVSRPVTAIQALVGAAQDGVYGPETTAKVQVWQGAHGLTADGIWGPLSDAAGFPPVGLVVDGAEGPLTVSAEQRALGVTVDGVRGPQTISAEQVRTGAGVDGQDGPDTTSHLQAYLNGKINAGLTVDGQRGPLTIEALQTALNAGAF